LLFEVLALVAEFESDLIRMPTRERMKIAQAKGRLQGLHDLVSVATTGSAHPLSVSTDECSGTALALAVRTDEVQYGHEWRRP
jgi:hypothetical protein